MGAYFAGKLGIRKMEKCHRLPKLTLTDRFLKNWESSVSCTEFSVIFEGDPFENGEIDVNDLAPALLALGNVVQSANSVLNDGRADARLKLRATQKGSFDAILMLDVSWATDLLDIVSAHPDRMIAAEKLADLLLKSGAVLGGSVAGLFAALRFLKGKKPDQVIETPKGTEITINQTTILVAPETLRLLKDRPTREAVQKFGNSALNIKGLKQLRIGRGDNTDTLLSSKDTLAFKMPPPDEEEPELVTTRRDVWLKIVTSQFKDGYKWRFTDGGERPFTADMEDVDFLNSVLKGDTTLSANDTLHCTVREEQEMTSTGLQKSIFVEKVIEHRRGPTQLKLI